MTEKAEEARADLPVATATRVGGRRLRPTRRTFLGGALAVTLVATLLPRDPRPRKKPIWIGHT
ncbi:MAG: hypothetical protein HS111_15830 [Kofleriaceae bacterium]|nr:hypothetical protein [Kofleriaceae bacterium]MCL4228145.1 hypothetical protein [Myxococcales bacterium]